MSGQLVAPPEEAQSDITLRMRSGHPQIAEGDACMLARVEAFCRELGRPPRIFNVGCGSGYLAWQLSRLHPRADVVAHETDATLLEALKRRVKGTDVRVFSKPFEEYQEPIDILISWGSHHHLPQSYLTHGRSLLTKGGLFLLGDEFCPEYCGSADAERIAGAELIRVVKGFVLTSEAELQAHEKRGEIPEAARTLEKQRQQALWRWYRYVIDYAMERDHVDVALYELRATHDDLITSSSDEQKLSPLIVEKDLALHGYRQVARHCMAPQLDKSLQSFFIYELAAA
ncbi:class I SAM-dependent methyltransferase [Melittangium boletus]|uniref:Methyltransferase domain-containing protein n=1 Tax=Melittangium boletus DSM 14713 TaxID=1294270 RepID=A0A250ISI0_9BACT|nr:class I SAM-dependent methyltransferase [Melittangium boletus]ATB34147.1 hypothetical protein MEBOL_007648 [Melittangium boletus DSM 14713]